MQSDNEMQGQEIQPPVQQGSQDGMVSKDEMERIIKDRIKNARQREDEKAKEAESLKKQLSELQKKFESGKATSNEAEDYTTSVNTATQAQKQGINPEELPAIIEDHLKNQKLNQSLGDATQKDPELKALMNDPASLQKITPEELKTFKEYDNAPSILKHLLTDDKDRLVFKATEQAFLNGDGGVQYFTFLNNLSRKLKESAVYPHPSNFSPSPSLNDVGETEEFSTENYIRSNYK